MTRQRHVRMNHRDGFVEHAGVRLHYVDWGGEGSPVLLIHATGFHARLWDPYALRLRDRFRVIALDQRGHGDSTAPPEGPDGMAWDNAASDVHALITALDIAGCAVAGHSSGGTAAAVCAGRWPGDIGRLLLLDPVLPPHPNGGAPRSQEHPGRFAGARRRRGVWDSPTQFADTMRTREAFARWEPEFLRLYAEHGLCPREDGQWELKCSPELEAAVYERAMQQQPWPALERLTIPVRLIRATGGSPTPSDAAAHLPNCVASTLPTTHFIPQEASAAVQQVMDAWLASESAGPLIGF